MKSNRKTVLYIAMSLDGYIAKPDDDLSFLDLVYEKGQDYGYSDFINTVDTVILGRKTYDWVLGHARAFPHVDTETYVITHTPRESIGKVQFYTGNIKSLINRLKENQGKNIFIDGGAEIVNLLLDDNLIDEFQISIIPILLGEGVRLFKEGRPEQELELIGTKTFLKGLVQLHYKKN